MSVPEQLTAAEVTLVEKSPVESVAQDDVGQPHEPPAEPQDTEAIPAAPSPQPPSPPSDDPVPVPASEPQSDATGFYLRPRGKLTHNASGTKNNTKGSTRS
ncbi:hypothetical protein OBBRIDRAFT_794070 [Obba rivulosa]|uniref:Uncharacterized protein n=1 Tax=Obba rivulosa TaxID=1052685 RepID=A0A8E2AWM8_9APHY|nr:hypothetical protein OBBRIDRAFT_794070 [Obba rivulosa]